MTLKNVIVGSILAQSPSQSSIAIMTIIVSLSLILPTLSTVYFSSNMMLLMNSLENEILEDNEDLVQLPLMSSEETDVKMEKNSDDVNQQNIEVINVVFESDSSSKQEKCSLLDSIDSVSESIHSEEIITKLVLQNMTKYED